MIDEILLDIKDLHTFFYTDKGLIKAVDGIDFYIRRGETFGLVGESGCGKSVTALSIMRLIQRPGTIVKGEIVFEKQDLLQLTEEQMQHIRGNRISMIFQEPMTSLNPVFRIGYQIAEGIRLHQRLTKRRAMDCAIDMLRKVGIPDPRRCVREYPHQLSGGMQQRVMIAMALSCNPEMLIADEPTTALDVTIQAQILELMNKLKQEVDASILLITHDLGVISEIAQSVAVMYAGRIVEYADVIELFTSPNHPYTLGLLESIPKMNEPIPRDKMLRAIPGVVPSLHDLPLGCPFLDRCSKALDACSQKEPPFIELRPSHFVRCWHYA